MSKAELSGAALGEVAKKWVRPLRAADNAELRLYCLPFAGGGLASFQAWPGALAPQIEVCPVRLPGREARFTEPSFVRVEPLVEILAEIIDFECAKAGALPYAIFGHSMGAVLTYELCRRLSDRALAGLRQVIVSGRYSPPEPARNPPVHHLDDDELVDEMVRRYNAIPQAVLEVPELLELVLPPLRADMEVVETYEYKPGPRLQIPWAAIGGREDTGVPQSSLDAWGELVDGPFETHMFDGGHFFIQSHAEIVLPKIRSLLLK